MKEKSSNMRLGGFAEKNGIMFAAEKVSGNTEMTTLFTFVKADENNKITYQTLSGTELSKPTETDTQIRKLGTRVLCTLAIIAIIAIMSPFFIAYILNATEYLMYTKYMVNFTFIIMAAMYLRDPIAIFIARISGNIEIKNFSKFFSAMNAVHNAFYDLDRAPTVEEAKKYSIYNRYNPFISNPVRPILIIIAAFLGSSSIAWYISISILFAAVILLVILEKMNLFYFLQFFIVSKPEEIHYEVAIKALERSIRGTVCMVEEEIVISDNITRKGISLSSNNAMQVFDIEDCAACPLYKACKYIVEENQASDNPDD